MIELDRGQAAHEAFGRRLRHLRVEVLLPCGQTRRETRTPRRWNAEAVAAAVLNSPVTLPKVRDLIRISSASDDSAYFVWMSWSIWLSGGKSNNKVITRNPSRGDSGTAGRNSGAGTHYRSWAALLLPVFTPDPLRPAARLRLSLRHRCVSLTPAGVYKRSCKFMERLQGAGGINWDATRLITEFCTQNTLKTNPAPPPRPRPLSVR